MEHTIVIPEFTSSLLWWISSHFWWAQIVMHCAMMSWADHTVSVIFQLHTTFWSWWSYLPFQHQHDQAWHHAYEERLHVQYLFNVFTPYDENGGFTVCYCVSLVTISELSYSVVVYFIASVVYEKFQNLMQ